MHFGAVKLAELHRIAFHFVFYVGPDGPGDGGLMDGP